MSLQLLMRLIKLPDYSTPKTGIAALLVSCIQLAAPLACCLAQGHRLLSAHTLRIYVHPNDRRP